MSRFHRAAEAFLRSIGAATLLTVLSLAQGCDRSKPPEFFPAGGVVLVNGEPVGNLCVAFHPPDSGEDVRYPVGRTDGEGRFWLSTESGSYGAPAGDYVVTIVWVDESGDDCKCAEPMKHDLLQGYYADPNLSGIRVTVRPSADLSDNAYRFHVRRPLDETLLLRSVRHSD